MVLNEFNKLFDFEAVLEYTGSEDPTSGNTADGDDFNILEAYYPVRLFSQYVELCPCRRSWN